MNKILLFFFALVLGSNANLSAQSGMNQASIEAAYTEAGFNYEHVNSIASQITQSEENMAVGLAVSMLRAMEGMKDANEPLPMTESTLTLWTQDYGLTIEQAQDMYKVAVRFALQGLRR